MLFIITPLVIFLAIATFASLLKNEIWWIRVTDFPRLQLTVSAILLLICELLFLDLSASVTWLLLTLTVLSLVYQIWWILPYTKIYKSEVLQADKLDSLNRLAIMTANVLTPNRHAEKLISIVNQYQPDVLVTLESDQWWQAQLSIIEGDYPFRISCPLDNLYGMHLYSKYTLSESNIEYLVEEDVPSIHTLLTLPSGKNIRMHFLHPAPPSPTNNEESSERDAELIMVAKSVAESTLPVVVTGDLNDVAWSVTTRLFRKISNLLDPRVGRGMFNTFHVHHWFMRWPLDHLFHSKHFKLYDIRRMTDIGSDHFPLLTTLIYEEPPADKRHTGLDSNQADQQWAQEKLQDEQVNEKDVPSPK